MGTHQGNPLAWPLFALVHFLCFVFFLTFPLHVISLPWPMTHISSTLPMLFPSFLIIFLPNWLLWGSPFNPTNVHPRFYVAYFLGLSCLLNFIVTLMTLGSLVSLLALLPLLLLFCRKL
jgi:hypothetical protein